MGRNVFASFLQTHAACDVWSPVGSLQIALVVPWTLADIHQTLLLVFIVACAALMVWLIWQRLGPGQPVTALVASVLVPAIVVWFPYLNFGQREHLFLAAVGPFAIVLAGRHLG